MKLHYDGNFLFLSAANRLTTADTFTESRADFSDEIKTKCSSLSELIEALTADLTKSTLLCARAQEADVTGKVSRKTSKSYTVAECDHFRGQALQA